MVKHRLKLIDDGRNKLINYFILVFFVGVWFLLFYSFLSRINQGGLRFFILDLLVFASYSYGFLSYAAISNKEFDLLDKIIFEKTGWLRRAD